MKNATKISDVEDLTRVEDALGIERALDGGEHRQLLRRSRVREVVLLQKANPSVLKLDRLPNLWFEIMRGMGPWYKMLAAAPDDPSLN